MKISTRGRYALRVMVDLALHHSGEFIPLKDVAERQEIPVKYLEQIIVFLGKANFLKSSRGNGGGYKLARSPKAYSVGDILRAAEGSLAIVACLEDSPNECPRCGACVTLPFWQGLNRVIAEYVDATTLEDLIRNDALQNQGANI